jgi:uncharacterized protein (DUF952 family)
MEDHLLFHLVTKSDWNDAQKSNSYAPESLDDEGFIHLSRGNQVERSANTFFEGTDDLLMLVIDRIRLESPIKYEDTTGEGEKFPHLYGPLNMDAVIDTIRLHSDKEGKFSIEVSDD